MPPDGLVVHPEVARLYAENAALRDEIARAHADLLELLQVTKPYLLAEYQRKLGAWELRVLTLEWKVARLRRAIAMVQAARNHGLVPDMTQINAELDREFATWQANVAEAARRLAEAQQFRPARFSVEEAAEFRRLFRRLVRALHPDLHPHQPEHDQVLWQRVMRAYETGDLEELRTFESLVGCGPCVAPPLRPLEALQQEQQRLRNQLAEVVDQLAKLRKQPPFCLQEQLADDAWVQARRREADQKSEQLLERRVHLEIELKLLTVGRIDDPDALPN